LGGSGAEDEELSGLVFAISEDAEHGEEVGAALDFIDDDEAAES